MNLSTYLLLHIPSLCAKERKNTEYSKEDTKNLKNVHRE